jgi:flagellar biosynthesis protein FlhA
MLVVPLPHWLLDLLLALNITVALAILLLTLYVRRPLEFSSFPSLLLLVTLFRLALNISATRLILSEGDAGAVIAAFGNFVIGGNFVVGIVVFIVLVVIQFVVITSGAGRVAEVAARFTLDALPGKQMAIDAELNAGAIDEATARARRQEVAREADFYGAMDGASKFTRGDAIAAVVMIIVNILGGFAVGMLQRGLDFAGALQTYSLLTVGEGLVTQVPALLVSAASGLIVTRSAGEANLGREVGFQILAYPQALAIVAGIVGLLTLAPGLPKLPFLTLAAGVGWMAFHAQSQERERSEHGARSASGASIERERQRPPSGSAATPERERSDFSDLLAVDPLEVELGYALVCLADAKSGGDLLERITAVRRQIATELGFLVPPIRVRDNVRLKSNEYRFRLRGMEIGGSELFVNQLLAMDSGVVSQPLAGVPARDPAFGLPAIWVPESQRTLAEVAGYTVADPAHVLVTHLSEMVRRHAPEILTRQDVQALLDAARKHSPAVVEELVPGTLSLGQVQKVLQALLRERVSIRDLTTILEAIADAAPTSTDPELITEYVRQRLARALTKQHLDADGTLYCFTMHPSLETLLAESLRRPEGGATTGGAGRIVLEAGVQQKLLDAIRQQAERMMAAGRQPLVLCASRVRRPLQALLERAMPTLAVLAFGEVVPGVPVESLGMVTWSNDEDPTV